MRRFFSEKAQASVAYADMPGEAGVILFIHGLGCSGIHDYSEVATQPALAAYRRLLVDLPGYGFSDKPAAFSYSVEDQAGVLAELIEALGIPRLAVFGHSMGGAIAISLCARVAERVEALIITEGNLDPGGGFASLRIAQTREDDYIGRQHCAWVDEERAKGNLAWAATLAAASPLAVHRSAASLVEGCAVSWREQLAGFAFPRHYLIGERSLPYPETDRLPKIGVSVEILPGADHNMANHKSAELATAIAGELARVGARR
ncbi:alpha/beta fold hydrolase [Niveibacterium terrae]|uniref:alpha/beta fold hydrolase n=1 Tax=Niveibacterium terrae TaxID=3373598 RepID=UPI003A8E6C85